MFWQMQRNEQLTGESAANNGSLADLDVEELEKLLDPARLPRHVAMIMDGNGRWAKMRGMPRFAGHKAGVDTLRLQTRVCRELGIEVLTVYAFSTENWARPKEEISFLLRLFHDTLDREIQELHANRVRVRVIGRRDRFGKALLAKIEACEELTRNNDRLLLNVGFNYGGRAEIVDAAKAMVARARRGELSEDEVCEELFSDFMYTAGVPDPDLVIRTGGESRISNFLLWQSAYAEIWFTPVYWPDFDRRHFLAALVEYQRRERRFGRI